MAHLQPDMVMCSADICSDMWNLYSGNNPGLQDDFIDPPMRIMFHKDGISPNHTDKQQDAFNVFYGTPSLLLQDPYATAAISMPTVECSKSQSKSAPIGRRETQAKSLRVSYSEETPVLCSAQTRHRLSLGHKTTSCDVRLPSCRVISDTNQPPQPPPRKKKGLRRHSDGMAPLHQHPLPDHPAILSKGYHRH